MAAAASLRLSASPAALAAANASCVLAASRAAASVAALEASATLAWAAASAVLASSVASDVLAPSTALTAASMLAARGRQRVLGLAQRRDRLVGLAGLGRRRLDGFLGSLGERRRRRNVLGTRCLGALQRREQLDWPRCGLAGCGGLVAARNHQRRLGRFLPCDRGRRWRQGRCGQGRMRQLDGLHILRRHDHARAHPRHAPQLRSKGVGEADAPVRGRIAGQHARVHGNARPGDALHERHRRAAVDVGVMIPVLLDHAEHAGWRRVTRHAGRNAALRMEAVGAVDRDALLGNGYDDEVRLWRRALGFVSLDPRLGSDGSLMSSPVAVAAGGRARRTAHLRGRP